MKNYLTKSDASSIHQTVTGMSNYLLSATATSTYQALAAMNNYVSSTSLTSILSTHQQKIIHRLIYL